MWTQKFKFRTVRERTLTSCFPDARMASTRVRPMPPVPPATATVTMLSFEGGCVMLAGIMY